MISLKKILLGLLLLFSVSYVAPVFAVSVNEVAQRINEDVSYVEEFSNAVSVLSEDDPNSIYLFQEAIRELIERNESSSSFYRSSIGPENDDELNSILSDLAVSSDKIVDSLRRMDLALETLDSSEMDIAISDNERATESFDFAVERLNVYGQDSGEIGTDYGGLIALSFWITLPVSSYLFLISRGNPIIPAEKVRNEFEFALFKSSLWPFGGALVSYVWYLSTPPGGSYYFLWWIILFGGFQFLRGLYTYFRYARPAINLAKVEEQEKLEKLLSSTAYQRENLKEKAEEIKKLKPVLNLG